MSSKQLFLKRLFAEWKFQYGVFRTVLDWTVIVYLVIPAIVIFTFIYRSWWFETPEWLTYTQLSALFLVGYLIVWVGHFRTYILDADIVFLIKHQQLFIGVKKIAFVYSLIFHALGIGVLTVIFLPFFIRHFQLSNVQIFLYFLLFTSLKWLLMTLKRLLIRIERRFLKQVINTLLFIIFAFVLAGLYVAWVNEDVLVCFLAATTFIVTSGFIYIPTLAKLSEFNLDLMVEKLERIKYIGFILQFSYGVEKTKVMTRTKPLLFRRSQRIFKKRTPESGLIELFIKVFIRNPLYLFSYFKIIAVSSTAITLIPPVWIKILIFGFGIVALLFWISLAWEKILLDHPITKKYGQLNAYFVAKKKVTIILLLVGIFILLVVFILAMMFRNFLPH
ncbi:ABC transporter permease [Bacillus aquiflavi]|uniref:ABC transporter permease n=1 Tax=Bacillus aquiflavi TaxID=2672567 RepID=A0A6B3VUP5_9BACI|nr:ABC transporter permease [Bacillus aquiflavi]MBA4537723.1 ABC transporter permease [Bacillus aquiflavi]NEY81980.1 hypothetical protein [Bacillus aquiflavi]UAC47601.1 ABC transporter permease [Bacillus aquiflavi]